MRAGKILVLGGTAEARALADVLIEGGTPVVSSLAGRVARPRLPVGEVRIGGFGGVPGLVEYLRTEQIGAVVDATHPFAAGISANAVAACAGTGVPLLRLARAGWAGEPGAESWHWVDDHDDAAAITAGLGTRPFLTIGRQHLDRFVGPLADLAALVRVVDPPEIELPGLWTMVHDRGPYDLAGEAALMEAHAVDVLVTKDSGGSWTAPKLAAATARGIPVVVVGRPAYPVDVPSVSAVAQAAAWVAARIADQVSDQTSGQG